MVPDLGRSLIGKVHPEHVKANRPPRERSVMPQCGSQSDQALLFLVIHPPFRPVAAMGIRLAGFHFDNDQNSLIRGWRFGDQVDLTLAAAQVASEDPVPLPAQKSGCKTLALRAGVRTPERKPESKGPPEAHVWFPEGAGGNGSAGTGGRAIAVHGDFQHGADHLGDRVKAAFLKQFPLMLGVQLPVLLRVQQVFDLQLDFLE